MNKDAQRHVIYFALDTMPNTSRMSTVFPPPTLAVEFTSEIIVFYNQLFDSSRLLTYILLALPETCPCWLAQVARCG